MYGSPDNTFASPHRRWGETSSLTETHYVISLTDTPSSIVENIVRSPFGGVGGVATHIGRLFGKAFNQRVSG